MSDSLQQLQREPFHALTIEETIRKLGTDPGYGLKAEEAVNRIKKYGLNTISVGEVKFKALKLFLNQFRDVFVLMLVAAAVISFLLGEAVDAVTISSIVALVAVMGFVQGYRAEKALEALKILTAPVARVLRNGHVSNVSADQVTIGDVILLEEGDRIPADARLIECYSLRTDEASLTGESVPVEKTREPVKLETPVADRKNMVFTGTYVVRGRGKAVVTAVGMNTELGKIAGVMGKIKEEKTPLQKKLDNFASKLGKVIIGLCIIIFVFGLIDYGFSFKAVLNVFMAAVALAISAVPEALPAVVTITLALGAKELAKKNAVIRRLASAETLGSVTYVCADKTGTLTRGEMAVRKIYVNKKLLSLEKKESSLIEVVGDRRELEALKNLFLIGVLCSNVLTDGEILKGDPTEIALVEAAKKLKISKKEIDREYVRLSEIPFSSERKRMTTIHKEPEGRIVAYMKGAPEVVIEKCKYILTEGEVKELNKEEKKNLLQVNENLASEGLRVLAMAYKPLLNWKPSLKNEDMEKIEEGFVFVGMQGMLDPPRKEAVEAVKTCKRAGIKNVMVTGDHKLTAVAIAKELGILNQGDKVMTGKELDSLSDEELEKIVEEVKVYARVSPFHKLRIVEALKRKGHVVAVTGDGVNDAPALKRADIGVSMGIKGTDVSKEASDAVLLDDNYATLITALMWGRRIYDNIRKYIRFLISCNFDELLVIGLASLAKWPLPMLPVQILWINLVTDGPPAVSLAFDPPEKDVIERPPRNPEESIFHGMFLFMFISFISQSFGSLMLFMYGYFVLKSYETAVTMTFIQAALFELFVVWNCRSESCSVWRMGKKAFENKFFVVGTFASIALTIALPYIPILNSAFHCVKLTFTQFLITIATASTGLFLVLPELWIGKGSSRFSGYLQKLKNYLFL